MTGVQTCALPICEITVYPRLRIVNELSRSSKWCSVVTLRCSMSPWSPFVECKSVFGTCFTMGRPNLSFFMKFLKISNQFGMAWWWNHFSCGDAHLCKVWGHLGNPRWKIVPELQNGVNGHDRRTSYLIPHRWLPWIFFSPSLLFFMDINWHTDATGEGFMIFSAFFNYLWISEDLVKLWLTRVFE